MPLELWKTLLPDLLQKKVGVLTEDNEKEYTPYLVNQALSYHLDCILHVNEININHDLDKKMQYDYYFHSLKGYKRPYQQWQKIGKNDDIDVIKLFFGYSTAKAKEVLNIITKEQLDMIRSKLQIGGR